MAGFIVKIMGLSALLAVTIKLMAPQVTVAANSTIALIAVCSPSLLMALLLGWRWQASRPTG